MNLGGLVIIHKRKWAKFGYKKVEFFGNPFLFWLPLGKCCLNMETLDFLFLKIWLPWLFFPQKNPLYHLQWIFIYFCGQDAKFFHKCFFINKIKMIPAYIAISSECVWRPRQLRHIILTRVFLWIFLDNSFVHYHSLGSISTTDKMNNNYYYYFPKKMFINVFCNFF